MDQRTRIFITSTALAPLFAIMLAPGTSWGAPPWKREVPANADGRKAFDKGDFESARGQFEKTEAEARGDEARRAAFNRGTALFKAGKMKEAEEAFGQAAATDDEELRSDALFNRGMVREKEQDFKGAIDAYRNSLLTNSANERARINLEQLLRMPPPPPQPQEGEGKEDDSKKDKADPKKEDAESKPGDKKDEQQAKSPEPPKPDEKPKPGEGESKPESGKLTEKEADDILNASERDKAKSRFLQTDKPPPDYDPNRNW